MEGFVADEQIQKLSEILSSLDAHIVVENTFVAAKRQEMKALLRTTMETLSVPSKSDHHIRVMECVREWQNAIIQKMSDELEWCCTLFPDRGPSLLISTTKALLHDWNPYSTIQLMSCLLYVHLRRGIARVLEEQGSVEWTRDVQEATVEFCLTLQHLLGSIVGEEEMEGIVICALEPTERIIDRSAQLEKGVWMDALDQISAAFVSPSQMDAAVQSLYQLTQNAIQSCLLLSGGTEMAELAVEMEQCWMAFLAQRITALKAMRSSSLPETSEDPENLAAVLHLLKVSATFERRLSDIDAKFRQSVVEIQTHLDKPLAPLDLVRLRCATRQLSLAMSS